MKKLSFLIAVLLLTFSGFSQQWMQNIPAQKVANKEVTFYDIQNAFNRYWEGREIEKGKGWKPFKRWEDFMEPRVYPSGKFPEGIMWKEYQKKLQSDQYKTKNANWEYLGPHDIPTQLGGSSKRGVGRVNCISFHPANSDIIWIGAPSGGFWKTINGGDSWETTTDDLAAIGVSDIVVNPENTDELYIVTGDGDAWDAYAIGILKSTDGGETWNTVMDLDYIQGNYFRRIIINPDNPAIMIASSNNGIYRTDDSWVTHTIVQSGHFKDLEFKPGDPNTVYATSFDWYGAAKVYKSIDGGQNWSASSSGITGAINRIELAVTPADSGLIYALCSSASDNGFKDLYVSFDDGETWEDATNTSKNLLGWDTGGTDSGGQGWYDLSLAVSPTNVNEVFVGGVNVWKSTNGGYNWSLSGHWYGGGGAEYVHADNHMFAYSPDGVLFAGNDGGIYKTGDGGDNWEDISSNLGILQIYRLGTAALDENIVVAGTQDNGTLKQTDSTWNAIIGGDGMECIVDYSNSDIIYGEYYYGAIQKSTDGGYSFYDITPTGSSNGGWVTPYVMHPTNNNELIAGYSNVFKTTNGGQSWTKISTGLTGGNSLRSIAYAPSNTNYIYTATALKIWKTTNNGENWENITSGLPGLSITYIAVSYWDPEILWLTFSGFSANHKVYKSVDGGENWINISEGLPNVPANCIVFDKFSDEGLYLGCDLGVYYRNAEMESWVPYDDGLPNVIVNELEIHYGSLKIKAATYGRGLWQSDIVVDTNAAPTPIFIVSETEIETGESTDFRDLSFGEPTSWNWTFEGGTPGSSESQSPTINYYAAGVYDVTFEVSNENGSKTIVKEDHITVNPSISADFTSDETEGIAPFEVIFTDNSEGEINTWLWDFGDGSTSEEQNPKHSFEFPADFDISLTVSGIYDTVTTIKEGYITANSSITAEFSAIPLSGAVPLTVNFTDNSEGVISSWNWNFGDETTSTERHPEHTYENGGSYTVELTISNNLYDVIETKTAYITIWPVSVDEINSNGFVSIFPNPSDGIVEIFLSNIKTNVSLKVFSIDGKLIRTENYNAFDDNKQKIDLSDQSKGLYIFKIMTEEKSEQFTILIE